MILNRSKLLAGAFLIGITGFAHSAPMWSVSAEGTTGAINAEAAFLASLSVSRTENFESGYVVGNQSETIDTALNGNVGSFTMTTWTEKTNGACNSTKNGYTYNCKDGLAVLDAHASPFGGRYSMPEGPVGGGKWLDSMDAEVLTYTLATGFNAVGFYITDANDINALLDVNVYVNDSFELNIANIIQSAKKGGASDGEVYYISIWDNESDISSLVFVNNGNNDGFGLDNVTIGRVPEPGTLALLGLGIAGLVGARRRQQA